MGDQHDGDVHERDPLAVGRGIVWGMMIGSLMWIVIIAAVVYFFI